MTFTTPTAQLLRLPLLVAFSASLALAQTGPPFDAAIRLAGGDYANLDDDPGTRAAMGAEVCFPCVGRYSLFAGFDHWTSPKSNNNTGYRSADSLDTGLRLQRQGGIRWFFDAGFAVGWSRYRMGSGARTTTSSQGVVVAFGAALPAASRFYIRPQLRVRVMSQETVAVSWGAALGWRFGR